MNYKMKPPTLEEQVKLLQDKVEILEGENVETTNCLYEIENRLQSQIDAIINYEKSKNFTEYELEWKTKPEIL